MAVQIDTEVLKKIPFFRGLDESELSQIASLCVERSYKVGEVCQIDGKSENRVHFITKGKAGVIIRVPNISYASSEIVTDTLGAGDVFGWSTLINSVPWSTLKVLEPLEVIYIETVDLLGISESSTHIGYIVMRNLAELIASRFRRNRMSTLNTLVAMKGV